MAMVSVGDSSLLADSQSKLVGLIQGSSVLHSSGEPGQLLQSCISSYWKSLSLHRHCTCHLSSNAGCFPELSEKYLFFMLISLLNLAIFSSAAHHVIMYILV